MHFLIDGYNLIYSTSLANDPYPLLALYNLVSEYCEEHEHKTWTCICDGNPPPYLIHEIPHIVKNTLVWSDKESADEVITEKARSYAKPNELCIVTDDKQIKTALSTLGATLESCVLFYQRLTRITASETTKDGVKDSLSIEEWEKLFRQHP